MPKASPRKKQTTLRSHHSLPPLRPSVQADEMSDHEPKARGKKYQLCFTGFKDNIRVAELSLIHI
eukprot:5196407-Prorocentrum_lima.AAC.1